MADNKIENLPIQVVVDGHTFEIDEEGNVTKVEVKPVVKHTISPDTQVTAGTPVTITIKATITEGTITKITKPDGQVVENVSETTYEVMQNGGYTFIVEGSNGATTTYTVYVTNSVGEVFSDIYKTTTDYTDDNGKTAKIPEGFAVGKSDTINKIDGGLVITDAINENHVSTGNQFVWIPVDNIEQFHMIEGYDWSGSKQNYLAKCEEPYTKGYATEKDEYDKMKASVEKNKGFYIGRYEAGKENNKVVVKKQATPYNVVNWGKSMTDASGGAVEFSKQFGINLGYQGVTSTLCYDVQWDAACQFLDANYINGKCSSNSYLVKVEGTGNFSTSLIPTGSNENYKRKNIYDMSGNVKEWTMGYMSEGYRTIRGGFYNWSNTSDSNYPPASSRSGSAPYEGQTRYLVTNGFRISLYIKEKE